MDIVFEDPDHVGGSGAGEDHHPDPITNTTDTGIGITPGTRVNFTDNAMISSAENVAGLFTIQDQSFYLGGFVATGVFAIIQTITPLLIY